MSISGCVIDPRPKPVRPAPDTPVTGKNSHPKDALAIEFFQAKDDWNQVEFHLRFGRDEDRVEVHPFRRIDGTPLVIEKEGKILVNPDKIELGGKCLKNGSIGKPDESPLIADSVRVERSGYRPADIDVTFRMRGVLTGFTLRRPNLALLPPWAAGDMSNSPDVRVIELRPRPEHPEMLQRLEYDYSGTLSGAQAPGELRLSIYVPPPKCELDIYEVAPIMRPGGKPLEKARTRLTPSTLNWIVFKVDAKGRVVWKVNDGQEYVLGPASRPNRGFEDLRGSLVMATKNTEPNRARYIFNAFGFPTGLEIAALQIRIAPCWTDPNCKPIIFDPCEGFEDQALSAGS